MTCPVRLHDLHHPSSSTIRSYEISFKRMSSMEDKTHPLRRPPGRLVIAKYSGTFVNQCKRKRQSSSPLVQPFKHLLYHPYSTYMHNHSRSSTSNMLLG